MKSKHKRKDVKVFRQYRHRPMAFLITVGIVTGLTFIVISVILSAIVNLDNLTSYIPIISNITLIVSLTASLILKSFTRIVLHDEGIEYHTLIHHTYSTWDNLSHLALVEDSDGDGGTKYSHHLILKDKRHINIGYIVPVTHKSSKIGTLVDVKQLLTTSFGHELKQRAPHIFEEAIRREKEAKNKLIEKQRHVDEIARRTRDAHNIKQIESSSHRKRVPAHQSESRSSITYVPHTYALITRKPLVFLNRTVIYGLCIIIGMVVVLLLITNIEAHFGLFPLIVIVSLIIATVHNFQTRLTTYKSGLHYRVIFVLNVFVKWEELSHLQVDGKQTKLYIKDSQLQLALDDLVPILHKQTKSHRQIDIEHLLTTPFGQDLQRYAPHVIEATRARQAEFEQQRKSKRKHELHIADDETNQKMYLDEQLTDLDDAASGNFTQTRTTH